MVKELATKSINMFSKFGINLKENDERLSRSSCVLLLADVFEKFRNRCLESYGLCPSHYLNAPMLSWDAILCMTKVGLGLISNIDLYLFYERGIRGGVSYISKRYSKANNEFLTSYDPKNPTKYITYLDKNNL